MFSVFTRYCVTPEGEAVPDVLLSGQSRVSLLTDRYKVN